MSKEDSGIEEEDVSNRPLSIEEVESTLRVVSETMIKDILKVPPRLAIELTSVHRCLKTLLAIMRSAPKNG